MNLIVVTAVARERSSTILPWCVMNMIAVAAVARKEAAAAQGVRHNNNIFFGSHSAEVGLDCAV
jgi:hypothetical protein